jgi:hypothetical protein
MENQANDQQEEELEEATKGLEPQDGSVDDEDITNSNMTTLMACEQKVNLF